MAKITGQLLHVYPTQQLQSKSGNQYQKRDFVIAVQTFDRDTGEPTVDPENTPQLTVTGDRCAQLDNIVKGQMVTVTYSLRGRRYRGEDNKERIINDINVISVTASGGAAAAAPAQPAPVQQQTPAPAVQQGDDLPF